MPAETGTFGSVLRAARERCGLSLQDIADITGVSMELWRDLERDDLAFWPDHLMTPTCLGRYANAVGLDSDTVIEEFGRVYPAQPNRVDRLLRANPALVHELE